MYVSFPVVLIHKAIVKGVGSTQTQMWLASLCILPFVHGFSLARVGFENLDLLICDCGGDPAANLVSTQSC